jgi:hypothetical protein
MARRLVLLVLSMLLPACGVLGAEEGEWETPRFSIGGLGANCTVLGDFTGDLFLTDGFQLVVVPEVGNGWGFGCVAGMRTRLFGGEISYTRSSHVGMWNGTTEYESRQEAFGVDIRVFPLRLGPLEPYALLGTSFLKLTVLDGVTFDSESVDAAFWGIGMDFGGGIGIHIGKHVSLAAQAVYRWARYNTVDDFWGANLTITDGLDCSGYVLSVVAFVSW